MHRVKFTWKFATQVFFAHLFRIFEFFNHSLCRWRDVFEVLLFFPNLKELILRYFQFFHIICQLVLWRYRHNIMEPITKTEHLEGLAVAKSVERLVLNACGLSADSVSSIFREFSIFIIVIRNTFRSTSFYLISPICRN